MKSTVILLFSFVTIVSAKSYSQKIDLKLKNAKIETVFAKIEKMSGYNFIYEKNTLKKIEAIDVSLENRTITEAMSEILKNQSLEFVIHNKFIVISPKENMVKTPFLSLDDYQFKKIVGNVKDTAGIAIPGVLVLNKQSNKVAITDANGSYAIDANADDILVFSLVGYIKQEMKISLETRINVTLREEKIDLGQVVVTALGIRKSVRALTYSVQEIKGEELTRNKDANFVNALAGKVAGVTINPSSSGIGGASRVVMRGVKSISGNNNVLYVVDGIPIPNNNGGAVGGPFAGVVSGEGISSINPEDIESISALTGPSATALYGNQGANGVIVVTKKKGSIGKIKINITNSTDFFSPFVMPRFQNIYGQNNDAQMTSWGTKLETPSTYKPKDFFQTGSNVFNSISISGGTEKSQTFFSAGINNANGIIRENEYNRNNFYLRHNANLTDKFTVDFSAMYAKTDDKNMIAQGQYHNPLIPIYLFPPGDDIRKYEVYTRFDPNRKISTQFWPFGNQGLGIQNPYWITDAESNTNKTDRYMLSATVKYEVFNWLNFVARVRMDNNDVQSEVKRPAGTDGIFASEFGYYTSGKSLMRNTYADLIASIDKNITPDLGFNANIGGSYQDDKADGLLGGGKLARLANFYSVQENTSNVPSQSYAHTQLQSTFATTEFDYKRWLFLNATGRYEWPSRLSIANKKSYFYPSVGISTVISDALNIPTTVVSFAKLRVSYAEVGNPPNLGFPTFSLIDPSASRPAPFPDFEPERTKSYEAGLELKFLKGKLSLNATVYQSNTVNQLLSQPLTGNIYSVFYYNAGNIQNQGIEAMLGYNARLKDFNWATSAIFTLNRNKIKRLSEGYKNPITQEVFGRDSTNMGGVGDLQNLLAVGGSTSDLYVSQALREDNQGNLWVDPGNGSIEKVTIPRRFIGHTTPDYTVGWRNNFTYKNFDLSFLVDARVGGVGVSYTQSIMDAFGVSQKSAEDRDNGGVTVYGKKYADVEKLYNLIGAASGATVGMSGYYVYSATNVRLREASFGYTLPSKLLGGKLDHVKVALTGRNLFMFYNKSPFDPESTSSTGTYNQGVDYFRQPSYRSFGFSVSAQF
ncbi:SusC/RagA family TonB-linked outer membrane protein [Pedobacter arcticus]|uniref:SusC/RagA family TonB-linked outer membrane protein n=1 Tax=Pedobacter arcticus TaxID=752140 RepID=UPI0002D5457D|nr:SusC/RagA family TonB-linked outer membrane protein [Pedobacter arcticus]